MAGATALDTVLNAALQKSRGKLFMASVKSNAFQAWAFATGRVEFEDGGKSITNPITIGRNPNIQSMRYYDPLPMQQTNEFTTLEYTWSRVAGSLIISDQEQDENQGKSQIFKLLTAKLDVLEMSIKERFSAYFYGAGAGNDPYGLAALIPDDPTSGTIGNLSRATETQWRTSSYQFGGTLGSTTIEEAFDDVMLDLTMNTEKPDIIVAGRNVIRTYRAAARDKGVIDLMSITGGKKVIDLGFGGTSHAGVPMLYDEDCPVNKAYFINSKYLRLHILKHVNMKVKNLVAPWNVDAIGKRILWQGQYCLWKAYRTHAVVAL